MLRLDALPVGDLDFFLSLLQRPEGYPGALFFDVKWLDCETGDTILVLLS